MGTAIHTLQIHRDRRHILLFCTYLGRNTVRTPHRDPRMQYRVRARNIGHRHLIFIISICCLTDEMGWIKSLQNENYPLPFPYCQKDTPPLQSFVVVTVPEYTLLCLGSMLAIHLQLRHKDSNPRPMIHAILSRTGNISSCLDRRQSLNASNCKKDRAE